MNKKQEEYSENWRKIDISRLRERVYFSKFKFEELTKQDYQDLMILDEYVYGDIFVKITESIERRHKEFLSETHPELRDYSYKQFYIKYLESELNKEFLMKKEDRANLTKKLMRKFKSILEDNFSDSDEIKLSLMVTRDGNYETYFQLFDNLSDLKEWHLDKDMQETK